MDTNIKIILIILACALGYITAYTILNAIHYLIYSKESVENKINVVIAIIFLVALIILLFLLLTH